jgi:hypothetical protein
MNNYIKEEKMILEPSAMRKLHFIFNKKDKKKYLMNAHITRIFIMPLMIRLF